MATFPTLSINPSYPIEEQTEDPTLVSPVSDGVEQARAKYVTKRRVFSVNYEMLPNADKIQLMGFVTTVRGRALIFSWTHPVTSTVYTVNFKELPRCSYIRNGYWQVTFTLREWGMWV